MVPLTQGNEPPASKGPMQTDQLTPERAAQLVPMLIVSGRVLPPSMTTCEPVR